MLSLALLAVSSLTAIHAQSLSVVEGVWDRGSVNEIKLFEVKNGGLTEVASSKVGENGVFTFAFYPEQEGFYSIAQGPGILKNRYSFYFKPGDHLAVKITPTGYELMGERNTPENKEMARWQEFVEPLDSKIFTYTPDDVLSTYVDFFPLLEEKEKALASYPENRTPNARFNGIFPRYKEVDFMNRAIAYIFMPRTAHPQGEDYPDYYRSFDLKDLGKDNFMLTYPGGLNLYKQVPMILLMSDFEMTPDEKAQIMQQGQETMLLGNDELAAAIDPTLRGELAVSFAQNKKTLEAFDLYASKYEKFLYTDAQKKAWNDIRIPLIKNDAGSPATDFTFTDVKGNKISLSDFKGKVVYVDVWATWCGPCKAQIPYLKKLEEEYKDNQNMVFIGVSVDKEADKQKWEDFLEAEKLPGIQIFAGDASNDGIMRPYKISGIPRFILVGKDGNLIYADAPRPSSEEEIRAVLNNALSK